MQSQRKCPTCDGTGKIIAKENVCRSCNGNGRKIDKTTVEIIIPAGAPNGYTVTAKGMADEQVGYETGDLLIVLREKPHEKYTRQGVDLVTTVAIDLATALIGGIVQFEHLDGHQFLITLPKGKVVRHGSTTVTVNRGMPIMTNPGSFGDLRVVFHVEMPRRIRGLQKQVSRLFVNCCTNISFLRTSRCSGNGFIADKCLLVLVAQNVPVGRVVVPPPPLLVVATEPRTVTIAALGYRSEPSYVEGGNSSR